jgi:glyoxylase-like metal-dependent hydrolase (beta-lactamase superfamily II)
VNFDVNDYSIWTFCYARGRLPKDFMGGCPACSNQGMADIPMLYSLVQGGPAMTERKRILVDCGFSGGASMTGRRFEGFEKPPAVLAKVGVSPADIDILVLTHLHFDHAGSFEAFPNARVLVQRREYERWKDVIEALPDRSAGKEHWALSSMDVALFERFDAAVRAGRIELIEGDALIAPGVHCRLAADTHTFGSQWVQVDTPAGPYVVAGDCVYWYMNVERMWPPGYLQGNPWNLMRTLERLRDLVGPGRLERIVPGHDMEVFARHASWTAGENPVAEVHLASGEPSRLPKFSSTPATQQGEAT